MDTPIIKLEDVDKVYRLYNRQLDRIKAALLPGRKVYHQDFYAISGVSLTVEPGETVGIIGSNGSGKSTILQIICGILRPTKGEVSVNGRISALLELGAGFNPEFTGRENVYLNGAILGLDKKEIAACFPKIESFADIGEFIDRPVKTYSSGMYVRLAFAVAINVNPDILIIDEALSVGDTLFQAKCFAKFREFQKSGITILFVTHSMDLITRYCDRAILLDQGTLVQQGKPKQVVDTYNRLLVQCGREIELKEDEEIREKSTSENGESRYGIGKAVIEETGIYDQDGCSVKTLAQGEEYEFRCIVVFNEAVKQPIFAYTVKDVKGFDITGTNTLYKEIETGYPQAGDRIVVSFFQKIMLAGGNYLLSFGCAGFEDGEYTVYERRYDVLDFNVVTRQATVGFFDSDSHITLDKITK